MSADNCVIIGSFPEWYRVLHCQASENLSFEEYVYPYFKDISPTQSKEEAYKIASDIYKAEDEVEYWIREITFMNTLDTYKKIYLWNYIWECIDSTFNKEFMNNIWYHKPQDGIINIQYDYYQDERTITHDWYNRKAWAYDEDLSMCTHYYINKINQSQKDYKPMPEPIRELYKWVYIQRDNWVCDIYDINNIDVFMWSCLESELDWFIDNLKQLYKIK